MVAKALLTYTYIVYVMLNAQKNMTYFDNLKFGSTGEKKYVDYIRISEQKFTTRLRIE